jgi:hypothetical protein
MPNNNVASQILILSIPVAVAGEIANFVPYSVSLRRVSPQNAHSAAVRRL